MMKPKSPKKANSPGKVFEASSFTFTEEKKQKQLESIEQRKFKDLHPQVLNNQVNLYLEPGEHIEHAVVLPFIVKDALPAPTVKSTRPRMH